MTRLFLFVAIVSLVIQAKALIQLNLLESRNGNLYYVDIENSYTWSDAAAQCEEKNMTLVTIETSEKQKEIYGMLNGIFITFNNLWIGGSDRAQKGTYKWVANDQDFVHTNWASNEPNNGDDDDHCVQILNSTLLWFAVPCSSELHYICEGIPFIQDAEWNQMEELKKFRREELRYATVMASEMLEAAQTSATKQLEEKRAELDSLVKSQQEEIESLRLSCENKISYMDKVLQNSRIRKDHEEEAPHKECIYKKLVELATIKTSDADEGSEVRQKLCVPKTLVED